MAKFFLFVFTILLSLSLGLFVGQNYLLSDDLGKPNSKSESPSVSLDSLSLNLKFKFNKLMDKIFANEEVKLADEELLDSEKETESPEEFISDQPEAVTTDVKVLTVKKASDAAPEAGNADTKALPAKTTDSNKEMPKVTFEKKEGWVIQVAAFQEMSDALKVEQQVKDAKFPHYFYKTTINGQDWYRVNVGPFESVSEATNYKQSQKVHQKFKGAFVRQL